MGLLPRRAKARARGKLRPTCSRGRPPACAKFALNLVPAKIISEGDSVFYLKRCRDHGVQKTLISDDLGYWKAQKGLAEAWRPPPRCADAY